MADAGLFLEAGGGGPGAAAFAVRRLRTLFAHLADLCDLAPAPSRRLDRQIAALLSARMGLDPDGGPGPMARIPRYTSLQLSALSLVPEDHWAEHRTGPGPTVLIFGPRWSEPIASARSREAALAICAAALRARAHPVAIAMSPSAPQTLQARPSCGDNA